jgi:2-polyprenyl-3-methyl-5-hydroxy-6-metoxy-1,4-benzoquinol methylase
VVLISTGIAIFSILCINKSIDFDEKGDDGMGVGNIEVSDLDDFIIKCDKFGGVEHPNAAEYISDFSLKFKTYVDKNLDPFSNEYYQSQIDLYQEISGRSLNQQDGEQAPVNVSVNSEAVNPYNSSDINFISKHSRTVLAALYMANLPRGAKVLDMGSGWGLSSELIAFCGASVTCVDINPLFIELNRQRAKRLNLPIVAKLYEFDVYIDEQKYDLIFFYESLHHAIKPWETIKHISKLLNASGKIAFAAEPVNDIFWPNWGLRLDPLSVYCIRKFGWFESGWSESFIIRAFKHAGMDLTLYPFIGLNNGQVGIATLASEGLMQQVYDPSNQQHEQHQSLLQHYDIFCQQYQSREQQHNVVCQQYQSLEQQHNVVCQQYQSLEQQHNALVLTHSRFLTSKLYRFIALIRRVIIFFRRG